MVLRERLELSRLAAQVPKTCVSTDSTIGALSSYSTVWTKVVAVKFCFTFCTFVYHTVLSSIVGAGKENRTPVFRLEICNNTIIRYPHCFGTGGRSRTLSVAVLETTALPLSYTCIFVIMAGSQGFEPWERLHVRRFSRPVLSTTQPAAPHNNKF